jgi:hypothetical protein
MMHRLAFLVTALAACSRAVNLYDEPDASTLKPPTLDAGDIPELDAGLDTYPPCAMRPEGPGCTGPVDFPCQFDGWVTSTANRCQNDTGCQTNGWLEVAMGEDGCVSSIGMDQPNDAVVACLLEEFADVRCPCSGGSVTHFFGLDNHGRCSAASSN